MTNRRRLIIFLTVIVGFILLVMIISRIGSSVKKSNTNKKNTTSKVIDVTKYVNNNSKVVLTLGGRINGDDAHRAVRITVDSASRTAEIIQGYQGNVINTQTAVNNPDAYEQFIYAIATSGFSKERKTTQTDDRGACPLGQRYVYEIFENDNSVMRRWSTSCGAIGTMGGRQSQINELFKRQITDYSTFTRNIQL